MILSSAVERLNSSKLIGSPDYSEKSFITNEVTATFSDKSSKLNRCNDIQYSTTAFRMIFPILILLGWVFSTNLYANGLPKGFVYLRQYAQTIV